MSIRKNKGRSIYLKAREQSLIITALERYQNELMKDYDNESTREEHQLDISLNIRNLLDDKMK